MLSFSFLTVQAQGPEKGPGGIIICPAGKKDTHTKVLPKGMKSVDDMRLQQARVVRTATFDITFGPGAEANPQAKEAFLFALDIWSREIASDVPIKVYADFGNLGYGVLAAAGPSFSVRNFSNAPLPDVYYPAALANALAGSDLYPDEPYDLEVTLGNGFSWYFGQDLNTPSGQYSFITVALHEIGHGLGFTGIRGYNFNTGAGTIRSNDSYSIYSETVELVDGTPITSLEDLSEALGSALTSGSIYQAGPYTRAGLNNTRPALYAPSFYQGGSSYAHWDEGSFPAGNPHSLMTPQLGSAESNFDIGDITRGLFQDMGWELSNASLLTLSVAPEELYEEINTPGNRVVALALTNISNATQAFDISADPAANWLDVSPAAGSIVAGDTLVLQVTMNAAGQAKGFYETSLAFDDGNDETPTLTIPVTMRVLDGTEAPLLEVDPASLTERIAISTTSTRTLALANTGDDTLEYSINIDIPEGAGLPVDTLYATDFEEFPFGRINDRFGWACDPVDMYWIAGTLPYSPRRHIAARLNEFRPPTLNLYSPTIDAPKSPYTYFSMYTHFIRYGNTWDFILRSPTDNTEVTMMRVDMDRRLQVYDAKEGRFMPTDYIFPEPYVKLGCILDKYTKAMTVLINDSIVYEGTAGGTFVEQLYVRGRYNYLTHSTIQLDDMVVTDGVPGRGYVYTITKNGRLAPGERREIDLNFDARLTDGLGTYTADVVINSNASNTPTLRVPVELQVVNPPTALLSPDDLGHMSIDAAVDDPPEELKVLNLTNVGDLPLNYTAYQGGVNFEPDYSLGDPLEGLDMARYGVGNTTHHEESTARAEGEALELPEERIVRNEKENLNLFDSIYYDTGKSFPDNFSGVGNTAYVSAMRYIVPEGGFTLSAVRNAFRTEFLEDPVIIMEVRRGGNTPDAGELLYTKTIEETSQEGTFLLTELQGSFYFDEGEHFWIIHKYPNGISYPQGVDDGAPQRPDTYYFSDNGGQAFYLSGFVFLQRALSGNTYEYVSLAPGSGEVQPGETVNITATFDASEIPNGTYQTPIIFNTNDPDLLIKRIPSVLTVSGHTSEIYIVEELINFETAFAGGSKEIVLTIYNRGLSGITISDISIDSAHFSANVSEAIIPARDSLELVLTFAPPEVGSYFATLTILSNADNSTRNTVYLSGAGIPPPILVLEPEMAQDTVETDGTGSVAFTMRNEGPNPLTFSTPAMTANALLADATRRNNTAHIDFGNIGEPEKSMADDRVGHPVEYAYGEDLRHGYQWIDSDEPGGPVYVFDDIRETGTDISYMTGDDWPVPVPLPFNFDFYGVAHNEVYINPNGFLSFGYNAYYYGYFHNQIPTGIPAGGIVAAMWRDLHSEAYDAALYFQAYPDRFVVQYTDMPAYGGIPEEVVTFQIVLYPNGTIDFFYKDVERAPFRDNCSVGIEGAGGEDGAQVAFNTAYLKDSLAIRFIKPDRGLTRFITSVEPTHGIIPPGGELTLNAELDASGFNDGVYYDAIDLSTNDPKNAQAQAMVQMKVNGHPKFYIWEDQLNYEPIFAGLQSIDYLHISNYGTKKFTGYVRGPFTPHFSSPDSITVDIDELVKVLVHFHPKGVGEFRDSLYIYSDLPGFDSVKITLRGTGVPPPEMELSPESVVMDIIIDSTATVPLTIENTGDYDLNYSIVSPYYPTGDMARTQYPRLVFEDTPGTDEEDNRIGPPLTNISGAPGTFGYVWRDNESGGSKFEWEDISDIGTAVSYFQRGYTAFPLPFSFPFYGNDYNEFYINPGIIAFEPGSIIYNNMQIPAANTPRPMIAAFWDNLSHYNNEEVALYHANSERVIVQWDNLFHGSRFGSVYKFQAVLYPDGRIKLQYKEVQDDYADNCTVGLQGPGENDGMQIVFNTPYLKDSLAISIQPPAIFGTLAPGQSTVVDAPVSAEGLSGGRHSGYLPVHSNDPLKLTVDIPLSLRVVTEPEVIPPLVLVDAISDTDIGPLAEGDVLDLSDYTANAFSIRAEPGLLTQSMVFDYNGEDGYQTDNFAPYALAGDNPYGDYLPVTFPLGVNTLEITPYSERGGTGEAGEPYALSYYVTDPRLPCYAMEVMDYSPGLKRKGDPIPADRAVSEKALGEPEENDTYNFVSLGFGGSITLRMGCVIIDKPGDDLRIVETSYRDRNKPCKANPEEAMVEGSMDGINWTVLADRICRDASIDLTGSGLDMIQYVRITDVSETKGFSAHADGYDVDGVTNIPYTGDLAVTGPLPAYNQRPNLVPDEEVALMVYPNPADGNMVRMEAGGMDPGLYTLSLYDSRGQYVYDLVQRVSDTEGPVGLLRADMPLHNVSQGIYLIRLQNSDGLLIGTHKLLRK